MNQIQAVRLKKQKSWMEKLLSGILLHRDQDLDNGDILFDSEIYERARERYNDAKSEARKIGNSKFLYKEFLSKHEELLSKWKYKEIGNKEDLLLKNRKYRTLKRENPTVEEKYKEKRLKKDSHLKKYFPFVHDWFV